MNIIEPYLSLRKIKLDVTDIITMCSEENPFLEKMTAEMQTQLRKLNGNHYYYYYLTFIVHFPIGLDFLSITFPSPGVLMKSIAAYFFTTGCPSSYRQPQVLMLSRHILMLRVVDFFFYRLLILKLTFDLYL